ncbi:MAG: D-cysteine desulfhydrase [Rhodobacterales bacterium]|nr:D-cysteine desulfhydrase [Rhodobacterales bacterium]
MDLSRFPRADLCHAPTPLEPLDRLSDHLGGPRIYVKRDDCTGLATGGNKTRKLEWLMGDALARGCDVVVTQGAVQTNHGRQTAAAAAKLGLKCELLLERRVPHAAPDFEETGNVLLDRMFGATLHFHEVGDGSNEDMNSRVEAHCAALADQGLTPYAVPGGGSNWIGALGYVVCAQEIAEQADARDLVVDWIIHATGSAGTQAGLAAGLAGLDSPMGLMGVNIRFAAAEQEEKVFALARRTAAEIGAPAVDRDRILCIDGYVGPGYGQPTPQMVEAVDLTARLEGLLLDPVYAGKAMAGLIGMVREGRFGRDDTVVFVHTGGSQALYAYRDSFA